MKIITVKVQIKVTDDILWDEEEFVENLLNEMETPTTDETGVINHLDKHGYEVMITDRDDKIAV